MKFIICERGSGRIDVINADHVTLENGRMMMINSNEPGFWVLKLLNGDYYYLREKIMDYVDTILLELEDHNQLQFMTCGPGGWDVDEVGH